MLAGIISILRMKRQKITQFYLTALGAAVFFAGLIFVHVSVHPLEMVSVLPDGAPAHIAYLDEAGNSILKRVSDGAEQDFNGEWDFSFAASGRTYAFKGAELYVVEDSILAWQMKDEQPIREVSENANGSHVSILQHVDGQKQYCILPTNAQDGSDCGIRSVGESGQWYWHQTQERSMILDNSAGERAMFLMGGDGFVYEGVFPDPPQKIDWEKWFSFLKLQHQDGPVWVQVPWSFEPMYSGVDFLVGHIKGEFWLIFFNRSSGEIQTLVLPK